MITVNTFFVFLHYLNCCSKLENLMNFLRYLLPVFFQITILFSYSQNENVQSQNQNVDTVVSTNFTQTNCPKLDSIIHFALNQRGKNYKYGTFGPNTFDCSGLMYYTFSQFGVQLGRSSRDQYLQGIKVELNDIQPGDLVFFFRGRRSRNYIGHVGLVVSVDSNHNFTFVHSSTPKTGVRIDYSNRPGYVNTFVGARRVIGCNNSNAPTIHLSDQKFVSAPVIQEKKSENVSNPSSAKKKYHVVKQGDTLYGISKKYKIPIDQILKKNQLKSDKIYPGQKLKI